MPFTLRPDTDMPELLLFSDGNLHALSMYRIRENSKVVKGVGAYSSLCWHGSIPSLGKFYEHYRRIACALGGLCAPEHACRYAGWEQIQVHFGPGAEAGFADGAVGIVTLDVSSEDGSSMGEVRALFRRHKRDWCMVSISSERDHDLIRPPYLSLHVDRIISHDITFSMSVPGVGFPVETLADFIESTKPKAYRYEMIGKGTAEIRYEPWPFSRAELVAALEDIEKNWRTKPRSRRKLTAARKEIEATRVAAK